MKKSEIARTMLNLFRKGKGDEVALMCEVTITCREHVIESRKRGVVASSSMYTAEEACVVVDAGELAQEVLDLLQQEDLHGVERVLRAHMS